MKALAMVLAVLATVLGVWTFLSPEGPEDGAMDAMAAETASALEVEGAVGQEAGRQVLVAGGALFSRVIRAGDFLFLSGALGRSRDGENGAGPETTRALESLKGLLEQVDASIDDLVKCTVFLAEIADYGAMNESYRAFFAETQPPARTALAVKELVNGAAVEVECMAYSPTGM